MEYSIGSMAWFDLQDVSPDPTCSGAVVSFDGNPVVLFRSNSMLYRSMPSVGAPDVR